MHEFHDCRHKRRTLRTLLEKKASIFQWKFTFLSYLYFISGDMMKENKTTTKMAKISSKKEFSKNRYKYFKFKGFPINFPIFQIFSSFYRFFRIFKINFLVIWNL